MSCLECDSLLQVEQQVSYSNAANNSKLCCLSLGIIYYKSINLLFPHSGLGRWAHGELSSVLLVSFSSFSGVLLFPPNVYSLILLVFVMYSIVFEGSRVGSQQCFHFHISCSYIFPRFPSVCSTVSSSCLHRHSPLSLLPILYRYSFSPQCSFCPRERQFHLKSDIRVSSSSNIQLLPSSGGVSLDILNILLHAALVH